MNFQVSCDVPLKVLGLSHVHEQSCYMKVANNRKMVNVCVVNDRDL